MKQYNVPGVCVAVINNHELEWIKCFGVKDVRTREPITLDTLLYGEDNPFFHLSDKLS